MWLNTALHSLPGNVSFYFYTLFPVFASPWGTCTQAEPEKCAGHKPHAVPPGVASSGDAPRSLNPASLPLDELFPCIRLDPQPTGSAGPTLPFFPHWPGASLVEIIKWNLYITTAGAIFPRHSIFSGVCVCVCVSVWTPIESKSDSSAWISRSFTNYSFYLLFSSPFPHRKPERICV